MKECIVCKKPVEGVRERKKFCSDLCRATYHQNIKLANGRLKFAGKSGKKAAALYDELMVEMKNIQFVKPTPESFDGKKLDRIIMDEPLKWADDRNNPLINAARGRDASGINEDEITGSKAINNILNEPPKSKAYLDMMEKIEAERQKILNAKNK
jgi:hypothetical protein